MAFSYNSKDPVGHVQPMAEINVIPLVDIMLVLLVIFIITAPLFSQAIPVDLPRADAEQVETEPLTVQVALDADGVLFVDGEPVAPGAFTARLALAFETGEAAPEMHLRADRATRYERVTEIMALARKSGITRIAFVTEAP